MSRPKRFEDSRAAASSCFVKRSPCWRRKRSRFWPMAAPLTFNGTVRILKFSNTKTSVIDLNRSTTFAQNNRV